MESLSAVIDKKMNKSLLKFMILIDPEYNSRKRTKVGCRVTLGEKKKKKTVGTLSGHTLTTR